MIRLPFRKVTLRGFVKLQVGKPRKQFGDTKGQSSLQKKTLTKHAFYCWWPTRELPGKIWTPGPIQIHQIGQRPKNRPGNRKVPRYKKSRTKPLVNPQALKSLICGCGARLSMVPVISKVTGNHWVKRSLSVSISKSWRKNDGCSFSTWQGPQGGPLKLVFPNRTVRKRNKDPGKICMICMELFSLPY